MVKYRCKICGYIYDEEKEVKEKWISSLYNRDMECKNRYSHENSDIIKIYAEFLDIPLSHKAHEVLHATYRDKSAILKEEKNWENFEKGFSFFCFVVY